MKPASLTKRVKVRSLPDAGIDVVVAADAEERARLAAELELVRIERLTGTYHVAPAPHGARVTGEVVALVRRTCVVSLDDFDAPLREPVDLVFTEARGEAGVDRREPKELVIDADAADPPEPLIDGTIDLGAVTREFLALGLDPYPRKPGVAFARGEEGDKAGDEAPNSPFAALADIAGRSRKN